MKSCHAGLGVVAFALIGLVAAGGRAEAGYQNEVSLEFLKSLDYARFHRIAFSLDVTRYFSEVEAEPDEGPYAEATFLSHVGDFGAAAAWYEDNADGHEGDGPAFGAHLTLSSPRFPLWASAAYARSTLRYDSRGDLVVKTNDVAVQGGIWFGRGLTIGASYERYSQDFDGEGATTSEEYTDVGGFGRWVWVFAREQALALSGSYTSSRYDLGDETGTDRILRGSFDFYFTRDFSFGVFGGWEQGDSAFLTGKTIGARAEGFLTPNVSVSASYDVFLPDTEQGTRAQRLIFGGRARF